MTLDILIPHYNEPEAVGKFLLDSIAIQQNVDFGKIRVVICNDGNTKDGATILSEEFLKQYPFVEYYVEKHKGVSAIRNRLLDRTSGDYIMYCDFDDGFYNVCALYNIFKEMESGFDFMGTRFVEESRNPEPCYLKKEIESTFVHGKVIRRAYLVKNDLRWDEELTIHEDVYFNTLCAVLTDNAKYLDDTTYLWRYRADSVCRRDADYLLKTYTNLVESNYRLVSQLINRGKTELAKKYACKYIYWAYYTMNKPEWLANDKYREIAEKAFAKKYFGLYKQLYEKTDIAVKFEVNKGVREGAFNEGVMFEAITFDDWLKRLECRQ